MNKKQIFMLSLLIYPLSYQGTAHARAAKRLFTCAARAVFLGVSAYSITAAVLGLDIVNKPDEQKTPLEREHPLVAGAKELNGLMSEAYREGRVAVGTAAERVLPYLFNPLRSEEPASAPDNAATLEGKKK